MDLSIAALIVFTVMAAGLLAAVMADDPAPVKVMPDCTGLSWEITSDSVEPVEWATDCCAGWEVVTDENGRIIGYTNG